jgi:hypothetical protein
LHFFDEITERGPGLRVVLTVFVPVVRPQGKKDADGNEDDFEEKAEEGAATFTIAKAHERKVRIKKEELGKRNWLQEKNGFTRKKEEL